MRGRGGVREGVRAAGCERGEEEEGVRAAGCEREGRSERGRGGVRGVSE